MDARRRTFFISVCPKENAAGSDGVGTLEMWQNVVCCQLEV